MRFVLPHIVAEAGPGCPLYQFGQTNADLFKNGYTELIVSAAHERLHLLASKPVPEDATAEELVALGCCDPVRLFNKNEPHKKAKLVEKRVRLIMNVSLVDQVVERVLYGAASRLEILNHRNLEQKPGLGLSDEEAVHFVEQITRLSTPEGGKVVDDDCSGWDFSYQDEDQWMVDESRIAQYRAEKQQRWWSLSRETPLAQAIVNRGRCAMLSVMCFSDGQLVAQEAPGIQLSGRYETSSGNSKARKMNSKIVGSRWCTTMGDDAVEQWRANFREVVARYAQLGKTVKTWNESSNLDFEFCSSRFVTSGSETRVVALNWEKMCCQLLNKTGTLEQRTSWLQQVCMELRHSPHLPRILSLAQETGWMDRAEAGGPQSADTSRMYVCDDKMTKKNSQNNGKAAARAALIAEGAKIAAKTAKKKSKGKGGFWNVLAGAAKMAADLAPVVAPLFLASHAPTQALAAQQGVAAPIAAPMSCSTCTGTYDIKTIKGKNGRVQGMRIRGMDYLGDLDVNSETAGSLLQEVDLNPLSVEWAGTSLQRYGQLHERYRPIRLVGLVEPSCPSTTEGQIISYIDADPDDTAPFSGRQAIQVASSHEGAEVSQVWCLNAASYAFDRRTQDFYSDANGSDERLISPGKWRIVANTDMPAATTVGSIYVLWEYEFSVPNIDEASTGGPYARLETSNSGGNTIGSANPLGILPWDDIQIAGQLTAGLAATAENNILYAMAPGTYVLYYQMFSASASISVSALQAVGDGVYVTAPDGGTNVPMVWLDQVNTGTSGMGTAWFTFVVQDFAPSEGVGGLQMALLGTVPADAAVKVALFTVPADPSLLRSKKTLQDFEREVLTLRRDVTEMRALVAEMQRISPATKQTQTPVAAAQVSLSSAALKSGK